MNLLPQQQLHVGHIQPAAELVPDLLEACHPLEPKRFLQRRTWRPARCKLHRDRCSTSHSTRSMRVKHEPPPTRAIAGRGGCRPIPPPTGRRRPRFPGRGRRQTNESATTSATVAEWAGERPWNQHQPFTLRIRLDLERAGEPRDVVVDASPTQMSYALAGDVSSSRTFY